MLSSLRLFPGISAQGQKKGTDVRVYLHRPTQGKVQILGFTKKNQLLLFGTNSAFVRENNFKISGQTKIFIIFQVNRELNHGQLYSIINWPYIFIQVIYIGKADTFNFFKADANKNKLYYFHP